MEDRTGSVRALRRNLSDSRTGERLFFSASLSLQTPSPSLVSLSPFLASPQQHSLLGKASHCPFSYSLLNLLFLQAKYPWKHIREYCPETLPQLYVGTFPPKINWEGSQINSRYVTERTTQHLLAELVPDEGISLLARLLASLLPAPTLLRGSLGGLWLSSPIPKYPP